MDGESPATILEGETPSGHVSFSHDRVNLTLLPGEPGMVGYLAPKYVLSDRHTAFANGAFKKTAVEQLPKAHHLYHHWPDLTIGKHTDAVEDKVGLRVTVQINEDKQLGRDVMSDYRFGIPYGWSIGFDPVKDRTATDEDFARLDRSGVPDAHLLKAADVRMITEVRWWEGSTVTWGAIHNAGPDTIQRRRSPADRFDMERFIEALRDGTLSEQHYPLIEQLVTEWQARAGAGSDHSTPPAPDDVDLGLDIDLTLTLLRVAGRAAA